MHQANPSLLNCNNEKPSGRWKSMYIMGILAIVTLFSFLPPFLDIVSLVCRVIHTCMCVHSYICCWKLLLMVTQDIISYDIMVFHLFHSLFIFSYVSYLRVLLCLGGSCLYTFLVTSHWVPFCLNLFYSTLSWNFHSCCLKTNSTPSFEV